MLAPPWWPCPARSTGPSYFDMDIDELNSKYVPVSGEAPKTKVQPARAHWHKEADDQGLPGRFSCMCGSK